MATTSGTCGVGTGTNGATAATFATFSIQKHGTTLAGCPECPFECSHCIDDIASDTYQVVITGVVNAGGDTNCADYNGTWIVAPVAKCQYETGDLTFSSPPQNCSSYAIVELIFDNAETLFGCNDGGSDVHAMRVWLFYGTSTTCVQSACRHAFQHSQIDKYDCDGLNEFALSAGPDPWFCDVSSATCTVTAL
jgi:hypothetical protein